MVLHTWNLKYDTNELTYKTETSIGAFQSVEWAVVKQLTGFGSILLNCYGKNASDTAGTDL